MALVVYNGEISSIALALTVERDKQPISAENVSRAVLRLYNRDTGSLIATVDSDVSSNVFFWNRTQKTVKGVSVFLFEMELGNSSLPVGDNHIARLTLYDPTAPNGISWKEFALTVR